jgi:hypothetical protein
MLNLLAGPTWEAEPVVRLTFAVKTAPRTAEQDQGEPHKLIQEPTSCRDTCTVGTNRFLFLFGFSSLEFKVFFVVVGGVIGTAAP